MTTTPTIWFPPILANTGYTSGNQTQSQVIGLANGNILVVWSNDTQDSNGVDVFARLISPLGGTLTPPFQLNAAVTSADEIKPQLVALPDGGFVMAYTTQFGDPVTAPETKLIVERFNSLGQSVSSSQVTSSPGGLTNWQLVVNPAGDYTIVYERDIVAGSSENLDVRAITYDFDTNAAGSVQTQTAQNTSEPDRFVASAVFANGHLITLAMDRDSYGFPFEDFGRDTTEITITNPANGSVVRSTIEIAGSEDNGATPEDIAVLKNGKFVALYTDYSVDNPGTTKRLLMKVGAGELGAIGNPVQVPTQGNAYADAHIVALNDGGFFVAWLDRITDSLKGQRYSSNALPDSVFVSAVGSVVEFATNPADVTSGDVLGRLSLTSDGRILATYRTNTNEVGLAIVDPRSTSLRGTNGSDVITAQTTDTTVSGLSGDDLLYGHTGNDFLSGGNGYDTIFGGAGHDELSGGRDYDTLDGGRGNDTYYLEGAGIPFGDFLYRFDAVKELVGGGTDTVYVTQLIYNPDAAYPFSYTLPAFVENAIAVDADGKNTFTLTGNALSNRLTGNSSNNDLDGNTGLDRLEGRGGNDAYVLLDATLSGSTRVYDTVVEAANGGRDTVYIAKVAGGPTSYTLPSHVEKGTIGSDDAFHLIGNSAANSLLGNEGNDTLAGGSGADTLTGGAGRDFLTGGAQADLFTFFTIADSGLTSTRDVITDFTPGTDKINVSSIDANSGTAADNAFTFLAANGAAFTGAAGQLRWYQSNPSGTANDRTFVEGNVNNDRVADFRIELTGLKILAATDFIL